MSRILINQDIQEYSVIFELWKTFIRSTYHCQKGPGEFGVAVKTEASEKAHVDEGNGSISTL